MIELISQNKKTVKKARREAAIYKKVSGFLDGVMSENTRLKGFFVSRVALSHESGTCTVYVSNNDQSLFNQKTLEFIRSFRSLIRTSIAKLLQGSWTPNVAIKFDEKMAKIANTNLLLDKVIEESKSTSNITIESTIEKLRAELKG